MSYDNTTGTGYGNTYDNTQPRREGIIGKIQDKLEERKERKEYERETGQGGTGLLSGLTGHKHHDRVEGTGAGFGTTGTDYNTTSSGYGTTGAGYDTAGAGYGTTGTGAGYGTTGAGIDNVGYGSSGLASGGVTEPVVRARVVDSHVEPGYTGGVGTGTGYTQGGINDTYGANTMSSTGAGYNQAGEDVYGGNVNPNTGKPGMGQRLKDAARDIGNDLKGRPHTNLDSTQRTNY